VLLLPLSEAGILFSLWEAVLCTATLTRKFGPLVEKWVAAASDFLYIRSDPIVPERALPLQEEFEKSRTSAL
jgi:hypothetical protein